MKLNTEDIPYVGACFRCGHIPIDYDTDPDHAIQICPSCGERGIVTVQQALDIINDHHMTRSEMDIEALTDIGYETL